MSGRFVNGAWVEEPVLFYCPVCGARGNVPPVRCSMKCGRCHNALILTDRYSYVDGGGWFYHIQAEDVLLSSTVWSMGPFDEPLSNL